MDAAELIRPLRALVPEIDTFQMRAMTELGPLHLAPHEPMPRIADGYLLADFPRAAVDAMLASTRVGPGSALGSIEVRHLEGALARRPSALGALASLDARFAVYAVGMAETPQLTAAVGHELDALRDALSPWAAPTRYPNFADRGAGASDLFPADALDRLRRIKAAHDPDQLITSNHPVELGPCEPARSAPD